MGDLRSFCFIFWPNDNNYIGKIHTFFKTYQMDFNLCIKNDSFIVMFSSEFPYSLWSDVTIQSSKANCSMQLVSVVCIPRVSFDFGSIFHVFLSFYFDKIFIKLKNKFFENIIDIVSFCNIFWNMLHLWMKLLTNAIGRVILFFIDTQLIT